MDDSRLPQPASGPQLNVPGWVFDLFTGGVSLRRESFDSQTTAVVRDGKDHSLLSVRIADAERLMPLAFQRQTVNAYQAIRQALERGAAKHPVRFWNFIPNIGGRASDSMSRYMVFNAGRFAAFLDWYGRTEAFGRFVATASGVGHRGRDLEVHCLSSRVPGRAIESPRQTSSYKYSAKYGPLPPSFARATVLPHAAGHRLRLLVGGTASIVGENSIHLNDVEHQTRETLANLAAVVKAAWAAGGGCEFEVNQSTRWWLRQFESMRVYYVRLEDRAIIEKILAADFDTSHKVEWLHAELCRPELLVEIEGTAALSPRHQLHHLDLPTVTSAHHVENGLAVADALH